MLEALKRSMGKTRTENKAVAYNTTGSEVLNLFALGGAVRGRTPEQVATLIKSAWEEDPMLALKVIFYLGDIREGQGERNFLRIALVYLAFNAPEITKELLVYIPFFSRWDVLYTFVDTPVEKEAFDYMYNMFLHDIDSEEPTLLAKWLKSVNTSSAESRKLGQLTAKYFKMTQKVYRKHLSTLRGKLNVVEQSMSSREWDRIDLTKIPGIAYRKYIKAFQKHMPETFDEFIEKVESGEAKMKSGVLYPYQVIESSLRSRNDQEIKSAELQWRDLPDYLDGNEEYIIPVIDTSGSMTGTHGDRKIEPILIAKSLGMYVSERIKGPFKDHYITFSDTPILGKFKGLNLGQKYRNMQSIVANTNIEAVFDIILHTAITNNVPQEEVPSKILIFSDMEFDQCATTSSAEVNRYGYGHRVHKPDQTLFEKIKAKYLEAGYKFPQVMFWNLDARQDQFPMQQNDLGVALVSGFSPSILKYVLSGEFVDAKSVMLKTLNSDRYKILEKVEV